ncbi:VOC family protein [uncultured Sulfitobacter sp.]|uniref:VOC family protein n=1 Tax=uncultured Sulfitobacter sp. TaxID=191468 RepID=UPI0026349A03|nr:VOC family protein [uncultured Sulfitobacter sp.]
MTELEHINVTVQDVDVTAKLLCDLFGWEVRWQGPSIHEGRSAHVGSASSYLALYSPPSATEPAAESYHKRAGLNHIGIVVDDLDAVEARIKAKGYVPNSHQDYEPGRRFYFDDENGIEFEIISYA